MPILFTDGRVRVVHHLGVALDRRHAFGRPANALANSSIYLEAVGHVVIAWIWLEQLLAARPGQGDFYDGKRQAARYFFRYELPKVGPQLDLLASLPMETRIGDATGDLRTAKAQ